MARPGPSPLILLGGLAATLILVTGALFLLDDGPSDPGDPSVTATDLGKATVEAAPALDLPVYDGREPPLDLPEPDLAPATLTGRIIDNQHLPIRMGTVEVVAGEAGVLGGILQRQNLGVAPVDIDERGGFRIEGLPVRDDLLLQIRGDTFVATVAGPFSPHSGETLDLGELLVDRGVNLTGTVYDTQGKGIPAARVMLGYGMGAEQFLDGSGAAPERITESDGDGGYELRHVNRASYLITAGAPGFASRTVRGGAPTPGSPSLVDFDIVLSAARGLRGTVFALPLGLFRNVLFAQGQQVALNVLQLSGHLAWGASVLIAVHLGAGALVLASLALALGLLEHGAYLILCRHRLPELHLSFALIDPAQLIPLAETAGAVFLAQTMVSALDGAAPSVMLSLFFLLVAALYKVISTKTTR